MQVRLAGDELAAEVIQPDPSAAPLMMEDLRVTLRMAEPAPDMVSWLVQLDLDGDPATGLQDGDLPGADLVIEAGFDDTSQRVGEAYLMTTGLIEGEWVNIRAGRVPVTVTPLGDATFAAVIALADLRQALDTAIDPVTGAALNLPFSFERLRWHAAVIQDGVPVDQYRRAERSMSRPWLSHPPRWIVSPPTGPPARRKPPTPPICAPART